MVMPKFGDKETMQNNPETLRKAINLLREYDFSLRTPRRRTPQQLANTKRNQMLIMRRFLIGISREINILRANGLMAVN